MPNFDTVKALNLADQRIVVSGGTQGIGASIALLCARLGAKVAIIGRNAKFGNDVLEKLAEAGTEKSTDHAFIAADLSTIANTTEAAMKVQKWAGERKVDYLFMSQGSLAVSDTTVTEDNFVKLYAVQMLSRFALSYTLLETGAMNPSGAIVSVAVAGIIGNSVDFERFNGQGLSMLSTSRQACAIIDCFSKEMNHRYQPLRVLHAWPGFVRTDIHIQPGVPWYIRYPSRLAMSLPFIKSVSPDEYAPVALWIAASEEARGQREVMCWNEHGMPLEVSPPALDDVERGKVWDRLVGLMK